MDHADPIDQGEDQRVTLERTIRLVEDEMRGAPVEDVLARLRDALPEDHETPEHNLRAAAEAIAEGRREDGTT